MAIRDLYDRAFDAALAYRMPVPPPATPLPLSNVILARPTPSGTVAPNASEQVLPIDKNMYDAIQENLPMPRVSAYTYVTTARKDGSSSNIDVPKSDALKKSIALHQAQARALSLAGNAANTPDKSISVMHWVALIGILGVAWFYRRK